MYERAYGDKYHAAKDLSTVEIAKLIRKDIKEHIEKGCLPEGKYNVRSKYFAGGSSIHVYVSNLEHVVYNDEYLYAVNNKLPVREWPRSCYTELAKNVLKTVERIANQYNYDGSEVQVDYFDVNFYFSADFDWQWVKSIHGVM